MVDNKFYERARRVKECDGHNIIVAGLSYGQGSSREHAALCPMYMGVKAIIAKSMERIHKANLINFGILPLTFVNESDYNTIDQGDRLEIPALHEALSGSLKKIKVVNQTKHSTFEAAFELSERDIHIILAGGTLNTIQ